MGWGSGEVSEERLRRGRTEMERESKLGNSLSSQQMLAERGLCAGNFLDAEDNSRKKKSYVKNPYLRGVYILIERESQ